MQTLDRFVLMAKYVLHENWPFRKTRRLRSFRAISDRSGSVKNVFSKLPIRFFTARKNRASVMLSQLASIFANASIVTGFGNYPKLSDAFKRKRKIQIRVFIATETKSTNVIDRYEFVRRGISMLRIPIFAVTATYFASVMHQDTNSFANIREVNERVSNVFYVNHRRESPRESARNSLIILRENKEEKKKTRMIIKKRGEGGRKHDSRVPFSPITV